MIRNFGYSHLLLRKAVLISSLSSNDEDLKFIDEFLDKKSDHYGNIVSSLIHLYEGNQSFIAVKRSI